LRELSGAFAHAVRSRRLTAWAKSRDADRDPVQIRQPFMMGLGVRQKV
jgi:hypothetical protein